MKISVRVPWATPSLSVAGRNRLDAVLSGQQWSHGSVAREAETRVASLTGQSHAIVTSSGTAALWMAFSAIAGQRPGSTVVVPAFGYMAAAHSAIANGLKIAVADTMPHAPVIAPESVERVMDDDVAAIVPIHYGGYAAPVDRLRSAFPSVLLLEDAAGALGAALGTTPCGGLGDAAIFSFHTSKMPSSAGEGGCLVTSDESLAVAVRDAGRHGIDKRGFYRSERVGQNLLMTDISAAVLLGSLSRLAEEMELRRHVSLAYRRELIGVGELDLAHVSEGDEEHLQNYQMFAIGVERRERTLSVLRLHGVDARPMWPVLASEQPSIRQSVLRVDGKLPHAARFAHIVINLPIHGMITGRDTAFVGAILQATESSMQV